MADSDPIHRELYEGTPLSRAEYISALVHLYRGELYRSNAWRIRLDATTNWAVLTVAGLLTFTFGDSTRSHWILLMGSILILVFWSLEARRFRFADVWRSRVRKMEENFYGPILRRDPVSPTEDWGELVAADLLKPRFKMSRLQAMRSRFVRNYWAIFAVLFLSWGLHVIRDPEPARTWPEVREHLAEGLLPWWLPLIYVGSLWTLFAGLVFIVPRPTDTEIDFWKGPGRESVTGRNLDL